MITTPGNLPARAWIEREAAASVGYGIYDCPPWDVHVGQEDEHGRVYHYTWGQNVTNLMCGGDSGGPTYTNSRVAQVGSYVNSHGTDHFGHVWRHYDQIQDGSRCGSRVRAVELYQVIVTVPGPVWLPVTLF